MSTVVVWLPLAAIVAVAVVLLATSGRPVLRVLVRLPLALPFWAIGSAGRAVAIALHLGFFGLDLAIAVFAAFLGGSPRHAWQSARRHLARARAAGVGMGVDLARRLGFEPAAERWTPPTAAPGTPRGRAAAGRRVYPFEDRYRIEGRLGAGGSTARLFVVRRGDRGRPVGDRLVLKYFDLSLGSELTEVVRESRGMQVAKDLGIVLDHRLERDHFYYVMPYYEGETLTRAADRVHRRTPEGEALPEADVRGLLAHMAELLRILDSWHRQGVIHKDVKPDNVLVTADGVRLVDLGLLTPLRSALTLTTHGTEYFRDPEMVRMALKGLRVREVDAVRFDVYSAGAVLFFLLEGSFPACGPLSRFSRPVPLVLSWITSRAMAEGDKRYPSIAAMRADLEAAVRLADAGPLGKAPVSALPSFGGFETMGLPAPPPAFAARPAPVVLESVRSRSALAAVMAVGALLVVAAGAVLVYRLRVRAAPPAPAATVSAHAEALVAGAIADFRREIEAGLAARGERPGTLALVPVLVVADRTARFDRLDLARSVRLALKDRGIVPDTSVAREEAARATLRPDVTPEAVQAALAAEGGGEDPPMVAWIAEAGLREAVVRCYYRGLTSRRALPLPAPEPPR